MAAADLTAARLREMLNYDETTGKFTWRRRAREEFPDARAWKIWNTRYAETKAGSFQITLGYIAIRLLGFTYRAHRLAWLYKHGHWPFVVDHINGVRHDNRLCNLREATASLNNQNRHQSSGKTGVVGVSPCPNGFVAYITVNGRQKRIGQFPTVEMARSAYVAEKRKHHPGFSQTA